MISYLKSIRAERVARRQYELVRLKGLMAENAARLAEIGGAEEECKWCKARSTRPSSTRSAKRNSRVPKEPMKSRVIRRPRQVVTVSEAVRKFLERYSR